MTYFPKVHALWAHAAKLAQRTAVNLGWTRKRTDKTPEHLHVEAVLERALREQARTTLSVLRQELLTVSAFHHDSHDEGSDVVVCRADMLAAVDGLLAEARAKRPSQRGARK